MRPIYNDNNIFAKILRGDIPATFIAENDHAAAFADIAPQAKIHILIIPKQAYCDSFDFYQNASSVEIVEFHGLINQLVEQNALNLPNGTGFRLISNSGRDAGQEVPHYHVHLLAGESLGGLLAKP